ncbi:MAG: hypothetical protein H7287_06565 [Thermoleophilia bacterium]|nr:hypothetical protein [Thermoleophilia bacterium]
MPNEPPELPLDLDDVTAHLLHDLAAAAEQGARGLHVELHVARDTSYAWLDADGSPHEVHLPTRMDARPVFSDEQPVPRGGPAAMFRIEVSGYVPSKRVVGMMASQLYQQAIRWGRSNYTAWDARPPSHLPRLPDGFGPVVQAAITSDVT